MSPKELLYIEDALGHEKQIGAVCRDAADQLTDSDLKTLASRLTQQHTQCFDRFYGLLK